MRLIELLAQFDETVANDEPSHLACLILAMHANRVLEALTG